jgi:hypothetical protein
MGYAPLPIGLTAGVGALAGYQVTFSNANSPQQLGGASVDFSGGFAPPLGGFGFGGDLGIGSGTFQLTFTAGLGIGGF